MDEREVPGGDQERTTARCAGREGRASPCSKASGNTCGKASGRIRRAQAGGRGTEGGACEHSNGCCDVRFHRFGAG